MATVRKAIRDLVQREQERVAEIEAVRTALEEGEKSGKPACFDANAFKRKLRRDAVGNTPIDICKCDDILAGRKFAAGEQPFFRRRPMTLRSLQTTSSHMLI
jgi:hypothetical protein